MNYQTKLVGIIATDDLPVLLETAFYDDFIDDDNLESLLDDLKHDNVINLKVNYECDYYSDVVEKLIDDLPANYYFIAIETPVHYLANGKVPCYSWGYTQTTWVFVKSLEEITKYRQMIAKMNDETIKDCMK